LYQQHPLTLEWDLWQPADNQQNPQITQAGGGYAFNVPEGMYYLSVEAAGYQPYNSQPIEVSADRGPVELSIPLVRETQVKVYLPLVAR
jgi:hypothetical protein